MIPEHISNVRYYKKPKKFKHHDMSTGRKVTTVIHSAPLENLKSTNVVKQDAAFVDAPIEPVVDVGSGRTYNEKNQKSSDAWKQLREPILKGRIINIIFLILLDNYIFGKF